MSSSSDEESGLTLPSRLGTRISLGKRLTIARRKSIGIYIKVANPWRAKKKIPSLVNPTTKTIYYSKQAIDIFYNIANYFYLVVFKAI